MLQSWKLIMKIDIIISLLISRASIKVNLITKYLEHWIKKQIKTLLKNQSKLINVYCI